MEITCPGLHFLSITHTLSTLFRPEVLIMVSWTDLHTTTFFFSPPFFLSAILQIKDYMLRLITLQATHTSRTFSETLTGINAVLTFSDHPIEKYCSLLSHISFICLLDTDMQNFSNITWQLQICIRTVYMRFLCKL